MTSYEIDNHEGVETKLVPIFDDKTWELTQEWGQNNYSDVVLSMAALRKLRDVLNEILEEN